MNRSLISALIALFDGIKRKVNDRESVPFLYTSLSHPNMLVHDTWLESLRCLGRCDLEAVGMLNKRTYSLTLSDKDISTVRRLVEDVTYRDDAYSLKGPRELRCGRSCGEKAWANYQN